MVSNSNARSQRTQFFTQYIWIWCFSYMFSRYFKWSLIIGINALVIELSKVYVIILRKNYR